MKKLAVFFPGIGYTVDKPLMHYSRKLATNAGFEIMLLPYTGFPANVKGDREKMDESYQIALAQSNEMLAGVDLSAYDEILFVGKSIGTIVAAVIATMSPVPDRIPAAGEGEDIHEPAVGPSAALRRLSGTASGGSIRVAPWSAASSLGRNMPAG